MNTEMKYLKDSFTVKGYGAKGEDNTTLKKMDVERKMIKADEAIIEVL